VTWTTKRPKAHLKAGQKLSVNQLLRYLSFLEIFLARAFREQLSRVRVASSLWTSPLNTVNKGDRPDKEIRHPRCHQTSCYTN
jgi:hypothetical protein